MAVGGVDAVMVAVVLKGDDGGGWSGEVRKAAGRV